MADTPYLTLKQAITTQTIAIVTAHNGQSLFDIGETAKICGIDKKAVGPEFEKHGISASKIREGKRYTATAIAEYQYAELVSPIQSFRRKPIGQKGA